MNRKYKLYTMMNATDITMTSIGLTYLNWIEKNPIVALAIEGLGLSGMFLLAIACQLTVKAINSRLVTGLFVLAEAIALLMITVALFQTAL